MIALKSKVTQSWDDFFDQGSLDNSSIKSLQRFQGTCNPTIKWENMAVCIQRDRNDCTEIKSYPVLG